MKAAALVALLLLPSLARAADDAPLAVVTEPRCYSEAERANIAKALVSKDARIKSLEADAGVPVGVVVALVVAGIVLGGAAGAGVVYGVTRR